MAIAATASLDKQVRSILAEYLSTAEIPPMYLELFCTQDGAKLVSSRDVLRPSPLTHIPLLDE
jgi:hypothetical protein